MRTQPRRKRKPRYGAIFSTLFLLNSIAGLVCSPLTSATKVRVEGASTEDYQRLAAELQRLRGLPCLQSPTALIESRILMNPELETVAFRQNLFGRGLLTIHLRTPVAMLASTKNSFLSDRGRMFKSRRHLSVPCMIRLPTDAMAPNLSLVGNYEFGRLAKLCSDLTRKFPKNVWSVEVDNGGKIGLNNGQAGKIMFGSTVALDEKLDQLGKILSDRPRFLSEVRELNLMAPSNPHVIRLTPNH